MKLKLNVLMTVIGLLILGACAKEDGSLSQGTGQIKASFKANYSVRSVGGEPESKVEAQKPEISDFGVRLVKSDGSYDHSWSSIAEFPTDTKFTVGDYAMEIYYGSLDEEGFDKPYYYGRGSLTVKSHETISPELTAKLANTMVTVSYTEAFKQYFTDYRTTIHSVGGEYIEFAKDEARAAYVKPGTISMALTLTKQNGTTFTFNPADIANAAAATCYNVKFDVNDGEVGDAVLLVTFDDATVVEPVNVTLSDELVNAPAPTVMSKGFESGTAINVIAGEVAKNDLKASVMAISGLSKVMLTTESEYLLSEGWPAEIDLLHATEEQKALLKNLGLSTAGIWTNPDKIGLVDFTGVLPHLHPLNGNSTHKFSLQVQDVLTRVCETPVTLVVNAPTVLLSLSDPEPSVIGSGKLTFTMRYNGSSVENSLTFKVLDSTGSWSDAAVESVTEKGDNTYKVVLDVDTQVAAYSVKAVFQNMTESNEITVPTVSPAISLSVAAADVWSRKATIKLTTSDASVSGSLVGFAKFFYKSGNGSYVEATNIIVDAAHGAVTINGLTQGTQYTVKCTLDKDADSPIYSNEVNFTTESATQVANAGMEQWQAVKQGYIFLYGDYYKFYPYADGESDIWWATNNERSLDYTVGRVRITSSCCVSYTTDAYSGSNAALIYTSGHGQNYASTSTIVYPESAFAGKLFIGSYSYSNHSGVETHGHSFSSRPLSMSFMAKYVPKGEDSFFAKITILSGSTEIATAEYIPVVTSIPDDGYKKCVATLNYTDMTKKATSIRVEFASTTKTSFSSSDFDKNKSITFPVMGSWNAHVGSILKIDDITLNY